MLPSSLQSVACLCLSHSLSLAFGPLTPNTYIIAPFSPLFSPSCSSTLPYCRALEIPHVVILPAQDSFCDLSCDLVSQSCLDLPGALLSYRSPVNLKDSRYLPGSTTSSPAQGIRRTTRSHHIPLRRIVAVHTPATTTTTTAESTQSLVASDLNTAFLDGR